MPSPIGHSIIGLCIYAFVNRNLNFKKNWKEMLLYIFLSNLSDVDVIPQLFGFSIPFIEHREILHGISFAFLLSLILSYYIRIKAVPSRNKIPKLLIFFALIYSHPIVDLFTLDQREPAGVMLLWPFSSSFFISPIQVLPGISHNSFLELFSQINYDDYIKEIKIFGGLLLIIYLYLVFVLKPDTEAEKRRVNG